jgi:squalene-associated FAD-dependent desaturase
VHLLKASDASEMVRWYDELIFLETNGGVSRIQPGGMPAPLHASLSFLQAPMLSVIDKVCIARGLLEFLHGYPQDDSESAETWLKRTGQTERAIKHFWEPVLVGSLNDSFAHCSTKYAGQVFHEAFLKSAEGGRLGIPRVPLGEMYGAVGDAVKTRGCEIVLRASVETIAQESNGWLVHTGEAEYRAKSVVLAVPFEQMQKLLPQLPADTARTKLGEELEKFVHAPITTVHLWWDRAITDLDHAVLLDTGIQWIFNKSRIRKKENGHYVELVISASAQELQEGREEIVESALRELAMFFPLVKDAKLLKSGVLKEARATFSVVPGLDQYRPEARTAWQGLYLAGDWTRTGWPSTMEGAVRSGYLAAEVVAGDKFLQPDLPAAGLMRLIASGIR